MLNIKTIIDKNCKIDDIQKDIFLLKLSEEHFREHFSVEKEKTGSLRQSLWKTSNTFCKQYLLNIIILHNERIQII
jgi:hypothetical protein